MMTFQTLLRNRLPIQEVHSSCSRRNFGPCGKGMCGQVKKSTQRHICEANISHLTLKRRLSSARIGLERFRRCKPLCSIRALPSGRSPWLPSSVGLGPAQERAAPRRRHWHGASHWHLPGHVALPDHAMIARLNARRMMTCKPGN